MEGPARIGRHQQGGGTAADIHQHGPGCGALYVSTHVHCLLYAVEYCMSFVILAPPNQPTNCEEQVKGLRKRINPDGCVVASAPGHPCVSRCGSTAVQPGVHKRRGQRDRYIAALEVTTVNIDKINCISVTQNLGESELILCGVECYLCAVFV